MKKILLFIVALVSVAFTANAETKEVTFDFAANPWGLPLGASGTDDAGNITEPIVQDDVTLTFAQGDGSSTPARMWNNKGAGQLRIYKADNMTITTTSALKIVKVVFTKGTWNGFEVSDGTSLTKTINTWTGEETAPVFTAANGTNQINKMVVTLSDEGEPTPVPTPEAKGDGTLANPYNAIAAINVAATLASGGKTETDVYVKGIISNVKYTYSSTYGTAQFSISDDGKDDNSFLCYNVLYLENQKFTEDNTTNVKVGDEVIICGKLTNYNGTLETSKEEAYLYSLNGAVTGINNATITSNAKQTIYSIDGRRVNRAVKGLYIVNGKKVIK